MVFLEKIAHAYRTHGVAPKIYDFIRQQEKDSINKGHNGVVVIGLNDGGKEIVEVLEVMLDENDNEPCFSLLSVRRDHIPIWSGYDWDELNFDYGLDDKLVILVDYAINTGESAFLALNELVYKGRAKYTRLAVIENNVRARNYPIQPDNRLSL